MVSMFRVAGVLGALIAGACTPPAAVAPRMPSDDAAFIMPEVQERPGLPDDDADATADGITPGDIVSVHYIGTKDLEPITTTVDRQGRVHLPLLGDVDLTGASVSEAEARVQLALGKFDRFSQVALNVTETRARIVTVTGAVEKPGNVPLQGDARLADVLFEVGGPRLTNSNDRVIELGDVDGARVMRKGKALPIDARRALEGVLAHNIRLRPGDLIIVPPATNGRIVVLGHVQKPMTFPYRKGVRLTEILADAGGLAKEADSEDVRILRGGFGHPRLYVANMKDLLAGVRPDVQLAPGDVIFVTEHWFSTVGDVMERLVPLAATGAALTLLK